MKHSVCVCGTNRFFKKFIQYKNETVFVQYEGIIIGKCTTCGLLKTFPSRRSRRFDPAQSRGDMYESNKKFFRSLFQPIVKTISKNINGKKVLDVGCSSGILMEVLKEKGYDVFGIEPNKDACELAKKKFHETVFFGTTKDFLRKKEKLFDAIIYNHVLEHIEDVTEELNRAKQLLKFNGIFVVGIPNTRNVIFSIRKKYWEPLMPNEHIWHFNDTYMKELLMKKGFKIVTVSYEDDKRKDYPIIKKTYFRLLSVINKISRTGEAVLITSRNL